MKLQTLNQKILAGSLSLAVLFGVLFVLQQNGVFISSEKEVTQDVSDIKKPDSKQHVTKDYSRLNAYSAKDLEIIKADADNGIADAQYKLSNMYAFAQGVSEDNVKAAKLALKASSQGHAKAQVRLGFRYMYGKGVEQSDLLSYMWFNTALKNGHEKAKDFRDSSAEKLSTTEIQKAQALSDQCLKSNYQNCRV